jgi:hypothetical protein
MRLFEFAPDESSDSGLATVLSFLANRVQDEESDPKISTQSLINMVKNSGAYFDYDGLVQAYENDDAVKHLIKDFNKDTVTLRLPGDEELDSKDIEDEEGDEGTDNQDNDHDDEDEDFEDLQKRDVVGDMAKNALNRSPNIR